MTERRRYATPAVVREIATPTTPAAGLVDLYAKNDHGLYLKDSTGVERRVDVVSGVVPASRIVAVGHSYLAGGGASMPDRQFGSQIAALTGADVENFGVGGAEVANDDNGTGLGGWSRVLQEPTLWASNRTAAPRVPNGYIGLTVYSGNDILQHHGDLSAGFNDPRTVHKNAMRTILSRMSASQIYEDTDASIVFAGATWQVAVDYDITQAAAGKPWVSNLKASKWNSGYSYRPFPANSATFTITIPADFEGGVVAVGLIAYPNSDALVTWSGTCSAATGTTALSGQAYNSGGAGGQRSSNLGLVKRFNCLASDAGKTIIGTVSGMATTTVATPSAPGAITHGGTPASTSYTYAWVAVNANGDTVLSTTTNTATGAATLTGTNTNIIPAPSFPSGAVMMKLIRTASGGTGNSGTTGLIATITTSVAVTDVGGTALAYTARTANPLLAGGAFDYWQIEAVNPNQVILVCGTPRLLPGQLPQVGGTGGYATGGGYVLGPAFGTTAITAGGGVAATTVTVNYAGLTTAQKSFLVVGGIVNLTGGANPTEAFYINAINTGTGVITLSTSPTSQVGAVTQSGHTTLGYGYASDADVANYNTDLQALCGASGEFGSTVVYVDLDAAISLNQLHYFTDSIHLNDRGYAIAAQQVVNTLSTVLVTLTPYQQATMGRSRRRPENFSVFKRSFNSVPFITDVTLNSASWANVTDLNGVNVSAYVAAKPGDWLEVSLSAVVGNQAVQVSLDAVTMAADGVTPINYMSVDGPTPNFGVASWSGQASVYASPSGSIMYQVKPADLVTIFTVPSIVLVQLRYVANGAKSLYMSTYPLVFTVKNLGQPSTFAASP